MGVTEREFIGGFFFWCRPWVCRDVCIMTFLSFIFEEGGGSLWETKTKTGELNLI